MSAEIAASKAYDAARRAYWDEQARFRDAVFAEIRDIAARHAPHADKAILVMTDGDVPRMRLKELVDSEDVALDASEELIEELDQIVSDAELHDFDEASALLFTLDVERGELYLALPGTTGTQAVPQVVVTWEDPSGARRRASAPVGSAAADEILALLA